MAQEQGLVFSIGENGWGKVVTDRNDACGDCGAAAHCCHSFSSGTKMVTRALNRAGAGVGDLVSVSLKTQAVVKSAAILYMIPVTGLISGAVAGVSLGRRWVINETAASILFAFAGLFLGFMITAMISRRMSAHNKLTPVITQIIRTGMRAPESLMTIDPVCRMAVEPAGAPASFTHKDKTYYFCNPLCREAFIKEPEKYV